MKSRAEGKNEVHQFDGQRAALFPALSEGSKEKRAVSILLACMERVPELSRSLLQGQGAPLGKTSRLEAWTETGPVAKKGADRPDGRIEIRSARGQRWVALLEAKIGKANLDNSQIEAYLAEGRAIGADALITISNDFAVLADHHPTYHGKFARGVTLLHWSWSSILTQCRLLIDGDDIEGDDHRWIIEHLVRFLDHPSTGVVRLDRMPGGWKETCEAIAAGAPVRKNSDDALQVAGGWIQETRDLGLQLTELLRQPVAVKLSRTERNDPTVFVNRVLDGLCDGQIAGGRIRDPRRRVRPASPGRPSGQVADEQYDDRRRRRPQDSQGARQLAAATTGQDTGGRCPCHGGIRATSGHSGGARQSARGCLAFSARRIPKSARDVSR